MNVEQSTVQSIVLKRRQEFRLSASRVPIDNRPAAIHALRSYLTICMPFTIEMEINTTITAYERGGASALDRPRLITHQTIDPAKPLRPLSPRDPVGQPVRPSRPPMEGYADLFQNYDPNRHTAPLLQDIQQALCVPREEWQKAGLLSRVHIAIYRQTKGLRMQAPALSNAQAAEIRGKGPCVPGGGSNYFERQTFANFGAQPQREVLDTLLRRLKKLPATPAIADAATLESADLRAAIVSARQQLKVADSILQVLPETLRKQFESHITRDLYFALRESDK
jgi:hypothetical protein